MVNISFLGIGCVVVETKNCASCGGDCVNRTYGGVGGRGVTYVVVGEGREIGSRVERAEVGCGNVVR